MGYWIVGSWTVDNNNVVAEVVSAVVAVGRPQASDKPAAMVLENSETEIGRKKSRKWDNEVN